jgi:hypothetical protein
MTRGQARRTLGRYSTRGRRYMDFFCLSPVGIRAAYGYRGELSGDGRSARRLGGRVVLLLTANRAYRLDGLRPSARLRLSGRTRLIAVTVGLNRWFIVRDGSGLGVLKVRHGRVEEVGVLARGVVRSPATARRFFAGLI